MKRDYCASLRKRMVSPRKWETRAAPKTGCDGRWKLSRQASSVPSARCMFGAIDRFGHRAWIGPQARIRFHRLSTGTSGLDPRQNVLTSTLGRMEMEMAMATEADAAGKAGSIIRLCGAVGRISAPVLSAIWRVTLQTCLSVLSSLAIQLKSERNLRESIKNLIR